MYTLYRVSEARCYVLVVGYLEQPVKGFSFLIHVHFFNTCKQKADRAGHGFEIYKSNKRRNISWKCSTSVRLRSLKDQYEDFHILSLSKQRKSAI